MKRLLFVVSVVVVLLALMGCTATSAQVRITDSGFQPAAVTVKAGGTVTWTNDSNRQHTVTFEANDSGGLKPKDTYSQTLGTPGTYTYYCRYHPNETCTVTVR